MVAVPTIVDAPLAVTVIVFAPAEAFLITQRNELPTTHPGIAATIVAGAGSVAAFASVIISLINPPITWAAVYVTAAAEVRDVSVNNGKVFIP